VLWGVHRDRIVVVEGVEELPLLVGVHRIVHDVGGWRVQMLEIKSSRDTLTMVSDENRIARRVHLRIARCRIALVSKSQSKAHT
jgi:hypothetical protein